MISLIRLLFGVQSKPGSVNVLEMLGSVFVGCLAMAAQSGVLYLWLGRLSALAGTVQPDWLSAILTGIIAVIVSVAHKYLNGPTK